MPLAKITLVTQSVKNQLNDFSDLEGDLDADTVTEGAAPDFLQAQTHFATQQSRMTCPRCRGTGRAFGGLCYRCGGSREVRALKMDPTSVARREKTRETRAEKKVHDYQKLVDRQRAFKETHSDVFAWLHSKKDSFEFATSLWEYYLRHGELTDGQLAAVQKILTKRTEAATARIAAAPDISGAGFEKLLEGFKHAQATGLKHPTLKCGEFVFSYASEASKNPGHVYVKLGGNYKGKITPEGKFFGIREVTREETAEIMRIGRDPYAAAVEHGRLTGRCAICSRKLVDPQSVAAGIGPICADKLGWSGSV